MILRKFQFDGEGITFSIGEYKNLLREIFLVKIMSKFWLLDGIFSPSWGFFTKVQGKMGQSAPGTGS